MFLLQGFEDLHQTATSMINSDQNKFQERKLWIKAMDNALYKGPVNTQLFNLFFKGLNERELNPSMNIYHNYYLAMTEQYDLIPDKETFFVLLKGVRLTNPPLYRFIEYFLAEIDHYQIPYSAAVINEILQLCGKYPDNRNNMIAAENWFEYYLQHIYKKRDRSSDFSPIMVFCTYMSIWGKTGDMEKVKEIHLLAHNFGIATDGFRKAHFNLAKEHKERSSDLWSDC